MLQRVEGFHYGTKAFPADIIPEGFHYCNKHFSLNTTPEGSMFVTNLFLL